MRFLKLLDPYETSVGSVLSVGDQQRRARELFPTLVDKSRMHYWRPGDPICADGVRILLGLAATFSLLDLRLADVVNEDLGAAEMRQLRVDVFNIDDCKSWSEVTNYFPNTHIDYASPPLAGLWESGVFKEVRFGAEARKLVLAAIGSASDADEVVQGLCPPGRELLEDE